MFFGTNLLGFPLLILVSVIDFCAFMLAIRLILQRWSNPQAQRAVLFCQDLTDPLALTVQRRLSAWKGRPVPAWAAWTVLCLSIWIVRSLLASLAVAVH